MNSNTPASPTSSPRGGAAVASRARLPSLVPWAGPLVTFSIALAIALFLLAIINASPVAHRIVTPSYAAFIATVSGNGASDAAPSSDAVALAAAAYMPAAAQLEWSSAATAVLAPWMNAALLVLGGNAATAFPWLAGVGSPFSWTPSTPHIYRSLFHYYGNAFSSNSRFATMLPPNLGARLASGCSAGSVLQAFPGVANPIHETLRVVKYTPQLYLYAPPADLAQPSGAPFPALGDVAAATPAGWPGGFMRVSDSSPLAFRGGVTFESVLRSLTASAKAQCKVFDDGLVIPQGLPDTAAWDPRFLPSCTLLLDASSPGAFGRDIDGSGAINVWHDESGCGSDFWRLGAEGTAITLRTLPARSQSDGGGTWSGRSGGSDQLAPLTVAMFSATNGSAGPSVYAPESSFAEGTRSFTMAIVYQPLNTATLTSPTGLNADASQAAFVSVRRVLTPDAANQAPAGVYWPLIGTGNGASMTRTEVPTSYSAWTARQYSNYSAGYVNWGADDSGATFDQNGLNIVVLTESPSGGALWVNGVCSEDLSGWPTYVNSAGGSQQGPMAAAYAVSGSPFEGRPSSSAASWGPSLGGGLFSGSAYTMGYNGSIAQVVWYNTAHSPTDVDRLVGYLAHKWCIADAVLPESHPYKLSAPLLSGVA